MKISGFSFVKNASKFYIPLRESIISVLPLVDEFVIVVGDNDFNDNTLEIIQSIESDKIKIYHSFWNTEKYSKNTVFAQQTDLAKSYCTGDWLIYIQADEVIHQNNYDIIKSACEKYLNDNTIDGFTFEYYHFWGNYWHYHKNHFWYPKEIRIIRNDDKIHSWRDAQSFRKYKNFEGSFEDYQSKKNSKLNIIELPAYIYHYGHARPPKIICQKFIAFNLSYEGNQNKKQIEQKYNTQKHYYGNMNFLKKFKGSHPEVMNNWICKYDWEDELVYHNNLDKNRVTHKHEKLKYRIISWIENNILGKQIFGFKNYISKGRFKL